MSGDDLSSITRAILAAIRAEGYAVSTIDYAATTGEVQHIAWVDDGAEVRAHDAETWAAKGPDGYRAAVALAEMLGFDLEG